MDKSFILFDLQPSISDDMQQVSACEEIQALSSESDDILVPLFLSDVQCSAKNYRTHHANCLTRNSEIAIHSQHCDKVADVEVVKTVAVNLDTAADSSLATQVDSSKPPKRTRRRRKASQDKSMAMPLLMGLEMDETSLINPTQAASIEHTENLEQNPTIPEKICSSDNSVLSEMPSAFDDAQNILMPQKQSEYEQLLKAKALANARLANELNVQPEEVYNPLDYCAELLAGIEVNGEHDEPNLNKLQDLDKSIAMQASPVVSSQYAQSGYDQSLGADYQVVTLVKPSAQVLDKSVPNDSQLIAKNNTEASCAVSTDKELSAKDALFTNKALSDNHTHSANQESGNISLDSGFSTTSSSATLSKSADLSSSFFMTGYSLEDTLFKQIASELVHHRTREDMVQILSELFQAQNFMTLACSAEHGQAEVDLLAAGGVFGLGGPRICIKLNYDEKPLKRSYVKDFQKLVAKYHADYGILISMHMFKHKVKPLISSEFAKIEFWDMHKAVSEITSHYSSLSAHIHSLLPLERSWVLDR